MLYRYRCENCAIDYEIVQRIDEPHQLKCPECWDMCRRVFTVPTVKKNEGFYSDTLGRWVNGQTDFEEGLTRVRYETDQAKWLNDNSKPKDEWIERKEKKLQEKIKQAKEEIEVSQEYGTQRE